MIFQLHFLVPPIYTNKPKKTINVVLNQMDSIGSHGLTIAGFPKGGITSRTIYYVTCMGITCQWLSSWNPQSCHLKINTLYLDKHICLEHVNTPSWRPWKELSSYVILKSWIGQIHLDNFDPNVLKTHNSTKHL